MRLIVLVALLCGVVSSAQAYTKYFSIPILQYVDAVHLNTSVRHDTASTEEVEDALDDFLADLTAVEGISLRIEYGGRTTASCGDMYDGISVVCLVTAKQIEVFCSHAAPLEFGRVAGCYAVNKWYSTDLQRFVHEFSVWVVNDTEKELLYPIMGHEILHVGGIGHSEDRMALMYMQAGLQNARLSRDDIAALQCQFPEDTSTFDIRVSSDNHLHFPHVKLNGKEWTVDLEVVFNDHGGPYAVRPLLETARPFVMPNDPEEAKRIECMKMEFYNNEYLTVPRINYMGYRYAVVLKWDPSGILPITLVNHIGQE